MRRRRRSLPPPLLWQRRMIARGRLARRRVGTTTTTSSSSPSSSTDAADARRKIRRRSRRSTDWIGKRATPSLCLCPAEGGSPPPRAPPFVLPYYLLWTAMMMLCPPDWDFFGRWMDVAALGLAWRIVGRSGDFERWAWRERVRYIVRIIFYLSRRRDGFTVVSRGGRTKSR